jgi:hypothetical protein
MELLGTRSVHINNNPNQSLFKLKDISSFKLEQSNRINQKSPSSKQFKYLKKFDLMNALDEKENGAMKSTKSMKSKKPKKRKDRKSVNCLPNSNCDNKVNQIEPH